MNKKLIMAGALALTLGSFATACGKKDDSIVISFWTTFDENTNNNVQAIANKFTKHVLETDGVKLRVDVTKQGAYTDILYKISNGFANNYFPTIAVAYPDHVANYIADTEKNGQYVVNLQKWIDDPEFGLDKEEWYLGDNIGEEKGIEDFIPSFIDEGRHYKIEGTYSLPFMKSTELLTYNRDMVQLALDGLNIEDEADTYMSDITWEDFIELAEYINDNRGDFGLEIPSGGKKKYPIVYDSDANLFITQAFQRNIPYISMTNGNGKIDFNNEGSIEFLDEMHDLHSRNILTTRGIEKDYGSNIFVNENCAFVIGSTAGASHSDPTKANFEAGIVKVPVRSDVPEERAKYVSQGVTLTMLRNPGDKDEIGDIKEKYGWKFMKYLTNTDNSVELCMESNGYVPARKSSYLTSDYQDLLRANTHNSLNCKTVYEQVNGNYFNYPVFAGSDQARVQSGLALTEAIQLDDAHPSNEVYKNILAKAVNNANGSLR